MLNRNNKIILSDSAETGAADMLAETLAFHGIKQTEFAERVGVSQKHLSQILNKKAFMSSELAMRIEEVTGLPAKVMLSLDIDYELAHLEKPKPQLEKGALYLLPYDWATA